MSVREVSKMAEEHYSGMLDDEQCLSTLVNNLDSHHSLERTSSSCHIQCHLDIIVPKIPRKLIPGL